MHAKGECERSFEEMRTQVKTRLKKWRVSEFSAEEDRAGAYAISAERGYGRELANLIFHIALVAVLVTVAFGRMVYYEGQVIVITNTGSSDLEYSTEFCNTLLSNYDSFRAGLLVV